MNNLVTVNNGVATTTSLIIAEQFGRAHKSVLNSLDKFKGRHGIVPSSYLAGNGKQEKCYIPNERQALIAMPFIGGEKSEDGQERLVDAFLALRSIANGNIKKSLPSKQKTLVDIADITHAVIFEAGRDGIGMERLIFLCDDFRKLSKANREIVMNQLIATKKIVRAHFDYWSANRRIGYLDAGIYEQWEAEEAKGV